MVEIKWTDNALQEIDGIAEYISKDSPNMLRS
jgi:plasmid stabilization system protein ParE